MDVYDYAKEHQNDYPNVAINTEIGLISIRSYIEMMKINRMYGGDFEIQIAHLIYDINIAIYQEIYYNKLLKDFRFISYINDHKSESRGLLILTNVDQNHWRLAYYNPKSGKINTNFKINQTYIPMYEEYYVQNKLKNNINFNQEYNIIEDNNDKKEEKNSNFSLKKLIELNNEEILKYYDSPNYN